jgi:chromosome segregation ATPase
MQAGVRRNLNELNTDVAQLDQKIKNNTGEDENQQNSIDTLTRDVSDITSRLAALEALNLASVIPSIQQSLSDLQEEYNDLDARVSNLEANETPTPGE